MDEVLADLQRRLANMVRRGVIHSVRYGKQPACRVEIADIVTTWLPLCQGFSGAHRADFSPCAVGDPVTVLSEAGELNNGRVFPGWNTGVMPAPEGNEHDHITQYGDGAEVRYNREKHVFTFTLPEGGSYEIVGKGMLRGPVEITDTLTVQGQAKVNADLTVSGTITDHKGTLDRIREVFNEHDHPGDSGGTTGKPKKQM